MMRPLARLRWQLMLSHLAAIAITIVSMVAAVVLIASVWLTSQQSSPGEPVQDARSIARAVAGLVERNDASGELDVVLRALASGDLRVLYGPAAFAPDRAQRQFAQFGPDLRDLSYIVVLDRDARPLASSDSAGAAFSPPERSEWNALAQASFTDAPDPRRLVVLRSGAGPAALTAYPVLDEHGRTIATVLVAKRTLSPPSGAGNLWQALAFFGALSIVILAAASIFALISSGLVSYLLSRRLVGRLERLGRAAESLASGDLSQRVEEGSPDEVGHLARQFNYMADRLASSMSDLEAEKENAHAALRAKRELVANVSHELRTPLSLIRSHVESLLMRGAEADAPREEYLPIIHRETEHLSRLIDDLFVLSTAEAGALSLQLAPIPLGEVVREVADSISPIAHSERRVTVVTSISPDLPPAMADRRRVVQVLGNLVRNALRHTPEGGLIALRTERQGDCAVGIVEDTGEGIPPERLSRIFERFYRVDDARDRSSGGAGLGLAIVRELVEAMGGDVSVESAVGRGSRFIFRLPLASE